MRIPARQEVQRTLNQCFVSAYQLNGRGVHRKASGILFLVEHGEMDFALLLFQ